jgi:hypothetical protein
VEEQIKGLDSTYENLTAVLRKERQKSKLMQMLYGADSRRDVRLMGSDIGNTRFRKDCWSYTC